MRYPGGLQLGGGVTNENAARYLEAGASHVIVTSYVFRDGHLDDTRLQRLVRTHHAPSHSAAFLPCETSRHTITLSAHSGRGVEWELSAQACLECLSDGLL